MKKRKLDATIRSDPELFEPALVVKDGMEGFEVIVLKIELPDASDKVACVLRAGSQVVNPHIASADVSTLGCKLYFYSIRVCAYKRTGRSTYRNGLKFRAERMAKNSVSIPGFAVA
jgi:hypothetical protein